MDISKREEDIRGESGREIDSEMKRKLEEVIERVNERKRNIL